MKTCQARIVRTYKTAKSASIRPDSHSCKSGNPRDLPVCGGELKFIIRVTQGCCCHGAPVLELSLICSRCVYAYLPGIDTDSEGYAAELIVAKALVLLLADPEPTAIRAFGHTLR